MSVKQTIEDQPRSANDSTSPEFDLFEWVQACWTNRWIIFATMFVAVIAITALNATKPDKHRLTALVSLSKSTGSYFADSKNSFNWPNEDTILQAAYKDKMDIRPDQIKVDLSYTKDLTDFGAMVIDVTALSPKTARLTAKGVADLFMKRVEDLDESANRLKRMKKQHAKTLKVLDRQTELHERRKRELASQIRLLRKTSSELAPDAVTLVALNDQLFSLTSNRASTESELLELERTRLIAEYNFQSQSSDEGKIKLVSVSAAKKVRPRFVTDAVFAGFAALLASIIVVFVRLNAVSRRD